MSYYQNYTPAYQNTSSNKVFHQDKVTTVSSSNYPSYHAQTEISNTAYAPSPAQAEYHHTTGYTSFCHSPSEPPNGEHLPEFPPNISNMADYLRTQLGKMMRVEFLIGGCAAERVGILIEVGDNILVLNSPETKSKIVCYIHTIKFVNIIQSTQEIETIYKQLRY